MDERVTEGRSALELLSPRARQALILEFGSSGDLDNPKLEWRRLFAELFGTFLLVLVAAGGGIMHARGQITLAAAVVAPGLMVMAIILFMGAVSGAHLNPGVSLAFALRGDFPWRRVPATSSPRSSARCSRACSSRPVRECRASRRDRVRAQVSRLAALLTEIVARAWGS